MPDFLNDAFNYVLLPALILGLIIFIHEMGHYLTAKAFSFRVSVFSIGFGREIAGRTDKNGTRWKLSIFPLGGYVRYVEPPDSPLYQRSCVAIAGPLANFLTALLILFILYASAGSTRLSPLIVGVNTESGAFEVGLRPGDTVLRLDGLPLPPDKESLKNIIEPKRGQTVETLIRRNGEEKTFAVPIRDLDKESDFGAQEKKPMLGVVFAGEKLKLTSVNAVEDVVTEGNAPLARTELIRRFNRDTVINFGKGQDRANYFIHVNSKLNSGLLDERHKNYTALVLSDEKDISFYKLPLIDSLIKTGETFGKTIKKTTGVIAQLLTGKKDTHSLGGVVKIGTMTGEIAESRDVTGLYFLIKLFAVLSINIGFMNLLPLPMLDGGHLVFHAIEAVTGRPPSLKVQGYIYGIGIMLILWVMLLANYHDLAEKFAPR